MTPKQKKLYDVIVDFWAKNKIGPSYRELAAATDTGVSNMYAMVDRLAGRGFIHAAKGRSRAIYPIEIWHNMTFPGKDRPYPPLKGSEANIYDKLVKENKRMRKALEEIKGVAECSEGVLFYAMLADKGLGISNKKKSISNK